MVVSILKGYMIFIIIVMLIYTIRHYVFAVNRLLGKQRLYYNDIYSSRMKSISVLIPMHNEELVLADALEALLECDYDWDRLEIIPINDNSTDRTKEMLDEYHRKYEFIRPIHRDCPDRGKPAGLNDAMEVARGEIIIVFDADYRPAKDMLKQLVIAFEDPEVGAVMGRVIPHNTNKNLLTRLINLERSGGYQVDQQARYNLKTVPQYGGTVGGFRKDVMREMGGFNPLVLAEDTELTYRLFTNGWKVIYANSAECYEEAPETWEVRGRQIRRWSRGHNQVMFYYFFKILFSHQMNLREKIDGILLLFVYAVPFLLAVGHVVSLSLFLLGEMDLFAGWWVLLFIGVYCSFGNFAPFYEIGTALVLDGVKREAHLLPLIMFNFYFYMWNISSGFIDAVVDIITQRKVRWAKTSRFAVAREEVPQAISKESVGIGGNEVQVVMYFLIVLFIVLLLFPIINSVFYLKKYKSGILHINQNRVRDARYFGKAFASLIESQKIGVSDNQIKLSQLETFVDGDVQEKYPTVVSELVICRKKDYYPPADVKEFQKEIYSAKNIVLNQDRLIARAVYSRRNIILGSGTQIKRWVDADGTLAIYENCDLGISASSKVRMSVGEGCNFRRLFAPEIRIGQYPGSNLDPIHGKNPKIYRMPIQINKERNMKYIRKEMINDDGVVDFSVLSSKNVIVNEKIIVQGDIRSHKGVKLCDDAVVCGNVFAEQDVILGRNAVILGNVFSQGNIVLEEGAVVGQQGRICSLIARGSITFSKNTFVFGYVSCEGEGKVVADPAFQSDVKPYENVNFLELNQPISKITFKDLYDYEHVDQQGFRFREELEEVQIPIGAIKVPSSMFFHCSALTKVVLPQSIQVLEDYAFADCRSLYTIPYFNQLELRKIGISVFENCVNMKEIEIPATVEQINAAAFAGCQSLTKIEFQKNSQLRWIGDHCFRGCKNLKIIRLPEQTEYVGISAFLDCENLERLQIPATCKDLPGILECPPEIIEIYELPPVVPVEAAGLEGVLR